VESPFEDAQQLIVTFEFLPADPAESDPALLSAVRLDMMHLLQQDGYMLEMPETGQRGGDLLAIIVALPQLLATAWAQRAVAEEVLNDSSALVGIFTALVAVIQKVKQAHEQRVGKQESSAAPVKMKLVIDGAPLEVEAQDLAQAELALKLALRFRAAHPTQAAQVSPHSKIEMRAYVQKKKVRRRR
jgi:hypothetical protein